MFKILELNEKKEWDEYLRILEDSDVQYKWQYIQIFAEYEKAEGFLCIYEDKNGLIYYPFLKRKIDNSDYFDITSQYGYGGPLYKVLDNKELLLKNFRNEFENYCLENNIVSEFIRFHPMIENHKGFNDYLEVVKVSNIVYVDLTKTEEEIMSNYKHSNRKCIKKAIRENVQAYNCNCKMDKFKEIYETTMNRNNANEYYYFNDDFFKKINENLNENIAYYYSERNEKIISTELILYSSNYVHSYLGGTLSEFFDYRPNNILKHQIILDSKENGIKYFVLGGGYTENDGIFNYKLTFNPNGIKAFYIGKKIHNQKIYNKLIHESFSEVEINEIKYFPLYRYRK